MNQYNGIFSADTPDRMSFAVNDPLM